jgi:hypothetical protein
VALILIKGYWIEGWMSSRAIQILVNENIVSIPAGNLTPTIKSVVITLLTEISKFTRFRTF